MSRWRMLVAASGLGLLGALLAASPAAAKGAPWDLVSGQAVISGGGMAGLIQIQGRVNTLAEPGTLAEGSGDLARLLGTTGLLPYGQSAGGFYGLPPDPATLGPRYTVTYVVEWPDAGPVVTQYMYPFAQGGPKLFAPPGQRLMGVKVPSAWWSAPSSLLPLLARYGFPSRPEAAPTAAPPPASRDVPAPETAWPTWLLLAILVAVAAVGAVLFERARRSARLGPVA